MNEAQQPLNALPQGHRLQEYELVRVLGFGGFGMTYLGFDHNLDKAVAIKEYLPSDIATRTGDNSVVPQASQFQDDFEWGLDRFLDEARALARFDHRHIIKVYRFFEAHGTAYIVMEYAEGETLSAYLERKWTLKEAELKVILYPLLDGLEVVHRADFLHRDIKPGNIIIRDEDNSPVLLDFGSARQAIGARSRSVTSIITPGYAPIEQYSSRGDQGPWTDIYALGGVCYRALTGEVPDDAMDRMRDDPLIPVVERCSGQASTGFLSAIDWALQINEEDRPQNIAVWRDKLEGEQVVDSPSLEENSISVVPIEEAITPSGVPQGVTPELEQQDKRRGKVLWGALGLCLLLVGLGGYLWWEKKKLQAKIEQYEEKFEVALGSKDFHLAGIYMDSIRAVDSDAPMLLELDNRLSEARQAERQRQEQVEKQRFVADAGRVPSPGVVNDKGETGLHFTARLNLPMLTISLLNQGADVNAKSNIGWTPLYIAAWHNAPETAKILLKHGADINAKNNFGWTPPLHVAALHNAHETAEVLLKHGANPNAKDHLGQTLLQVAALRNAHETAEVLLKYGAVPNDSWTPLHFAALHNVLETVKILLKQGADVNAKTDYGWTPLHFAVGNNAYEIAEMLLKQGADVNTKDKDGETPLHIAVRNNAHKMAEMLLKHGADVNVKEKLLGGWTPLHTAAGASNAHETAEILLKQGANVNAQDKDGRTPLHVAALHNNHKIAEMLLKHGADVNAKNSFGDTPLHGTETFNAYETASVLRRYGGHR